MLEKTGVPTKEELKRFIPSKKRRCEGPYAMIECFEEIPCDPCYAACPFKAVKEFVNINDLPEIDFDRCTGCGLCVSECPGLAIFLIDETVGNNQASISMPYEFQPLPEKGESVLAVDREGNIVGEVIVDEVKISGRKAKTPMVTILVPLNQVMDIRHFYLKRLNERR